jgi:hypothetical protein
MYKSNENSLPNLDYSNLPTDIAEAVSSEPYKINETGKLTFDGRQFIIRIPKEIANEAHITENTRVEFNFTKPLPNENKEAKPQDVSIKLI